MIKYCFIIILLSSLFSSAQTIDKSGKGYFYWGYNRAYFGQSDIQLIGEGYDILLEDVLARDRPTPYANNIYFNPAKLTIPQFNIRFGYYLKKDVHLSFGWDHMKYVMDDWQVVNITGNIDSDVSSLYGGEYISGDRIQLNPENFLHIEHSDGLNYVRFNLNKSVELKSLWKDRIQVSLDFGVGTGLMLPQTDITFLGERTNNNSKVYVQGYGFSANYGVNIDLFKHFFLRGISHNGYINMPWIRTRGDASDRAKQSIFFHEYMVVFGAYIPVQKKEK
jgi:hypothetical protein